MAIDTRARLNGAGYSAATVTKAPPWHGLVAWDLLFNNMTTGLFLVAATAELTVPEVFTLVAKAAYPLALVLLVTDLACLVLDLGDPLRFHHMLRVFKPTSPMSLGTWSLTLYSLPLTVAAALSVLPAVWPALAAWPALEWVRKAAVILGVLPALGSALYKGVLLSTNSQPGWRDARWLGGYLTNSAVVLGCAVALVLAVLLGQERASALLGSSLALLLLLNLFPLGLMIRNFFPTLSRVYTVGQFGGLGALCLGLGTVAPLALLFAGDSLPYVLVGVLSLLAGSLALRFVIVRLPHAFS